MLYANFYSNFSLFLYGNREKYTVKKRVSTETKGYRRYPFSVPCRVARPSAVPASWKEYEKKRLSIHCHGKSERVCTKMDVSEIV